MQKVVYEILDIALPIFETLRNHQRDISDFVLDLREYLVEILKDLLLVQVSELVEYDVLAKLFSHPVQSHLIAPAGVLYAAHSVLVKQGRNELVHELALLQVETAKNAVQILLWNPMGNLNRQLVFSLLVLLTLLVKGKCITLVSDRNDMNFWLQEQRTVLYLRLRRNQNFPDSALDRAANLFKFVPQSELVLLGGQVFDC